MNRRHLLIASLVGGLVSTLLVNTPILNLINVLLCAGFWIGPIVAAWLYRRFSLTLTMQQALAAGVLAGAWHGLFCLILSPLGMAGAGGALSGVQDFVPAQDLPDLETALTGVGGMLFNLIGVAIDLLFGLLGGLVGGALLRTRREGTRSPE